jgi:hypothetical protein
MLLLSYVYLIIDSISIYLEQVISEKYHPPNPGPSYPCRNPLRSIIMIQLK